VEPENLIVWRAFLHHAASELKPILWGWLFSCVTLAALCVFVLARIAGGLLVVNLGGSNMRYVYQGEKKDGSAGLFSFFTFVMDPKLLFITNVKKPKNKGAIIMRLSGVPALGQVFLGITQKTPDCFQINKFLFDSSGYCFGNYDGARFGWDVMPFDNSVNVLPCAS